MKKNSKSQKSGDNSVNIQADKVSIKGGLTYTEVKKIALDIFKSNFIKLSKEAGDIARERAEEITDQFINELKENNPTGLRNMQDPDMQNALFTVQKEYARTGDKNLADVLLDLLIDRSKEDDRNILQIVLNESLNIVSKLTQEQMDILTIVFMVTHTSYRKMTNLNALTEYLEKSYAPFVNSITKNRVSYQHLEYTGCGTIIGIASKNIISILQNRYPGIFSKGFPETELNTITEDKDLQRKLFIPCIRNGEMFQINAVDKGVIQEYKDKYNLTPDQVDKLNKLSKKYIMDSKDVKKDLIERNKCMEKLIDVWENSYMQNFNLTSVGISIGHANYRKATKESIDLSIWIN